MYIVVGRNLINKMNGISVCHMCDYLDDSTYDYKCMGSWDIMKATLNGEVLYDRNKVDWSKVEVDTKILVRCTDYDPWIKRYFAKYEDGTIYAWSSGKTSFTNESDCVLTNWNKAKLYEN